MTQIECDTAEFCQEIVDELDTKLANVLEDVRASQFFRTVTDPATSPDLVIAFMRELLGEVYSYQKRIDEVVFHAVGRFGRHIEEQPLVRSMIAVQIEEVGHGTMGLEDHVALGGDREIAMTRRPSPEAAAIIGVTRYVCEDEDPLAHLGFMYFFERFTTIIIDEIAPTLERVGYPNDRLRFMRLHAEEDIRHADMLANVIAQCAAKYAGARESVHYGFDCFHAVYPLPIWSAAFRRAQAQLKL